MSKPQVRRERVLKLLDKHGVDLRKEKVALVGVRGYFRDSMGAKGKNDIGIYDDAFIWIDESDMATFNGNTDPSRYYSKVATLDSGLWRYKKGLHGYGRSTPPYPAYRQAAPVRVLRYANGKPSIADTGDFGINIHRGGANTTSSAGCQTVPPDQWNAFKAYGDMLLARSGKAGFPYLLVEEDGTISFPAAPIPEEAIGYKTHPRWHHEWTPMLVNALKNHGTGLLSAPIEGCYGDRIQFWVMLFSALCEFESGFKPEVTYTENFPDGSGKPVVSRGLFQISLSSANQARYGNHFKSEQELHDPEKNIIGSVRIADFLVTDDGIVYGGRSKAWKGMARYWSPFRSAIKSKAIMDRVKAAQA